MTESDLIQMVSHSQIDRQYMLNSTLQHLTLGWNIPQNKMYSKSASQCHTFQCSVLPCPCRTPYKDHKIIVHRAIGLTFKMFRSPIVIWQGVYEMAGMNSGWTAAADVVCLLRVKSTRQGESISFRAAGEATQILPCGL